MQALFEEFDDTPIEQINEENNEETRAYVEKFKPLEDSSIFRNEFSKIKTFHYVKETSKSLNALDVLDDMDDRICAHGLLNLAETQDYDICKERLLQMSRGFEATKEDLDRADGAMKLYKQWFDTYASVQDLMKFIKATLAYMRAKHTYWAFIMEIHKIYKFNQMRIKNQSMTCPESPMLSWKY